MKNRSHYFFNTPRESLSKIITWMDKIRKMLQAFSNSIIRGKHFIGIN